MHNNIYHDIRVENLTTIMKANFGSWNSLCKAIDKNSSYINGVIKGVKREFTENLAREIESKLKLKFGSLDIKNGAKEEQRYANIKVYSPLLSAGHGNDIFSEEEIGEFSIPMQLIKKKHLERNKLVCLSVSGDSMEGKINDGAYVVIDTTKKEIINNKIYAFSINNVIKVKRLFNALGGLIIKSDNPSYPEEKFSSIEMHDKDINFFIVGKVEIILNVE